MKSETQKRMQGQNNKEPFGNLHARFLLTSGQLIKVSLAINTEGEAHVL